ncbi:hypothetical protein FRX31_007100 [Thalictrum thalictroides]|uniref:Uncharacterized protein n=1 Tax=Thalictrum thalictroides TaxID=46969 RepID=A0A7J6X1V3_THATH|nr:hypothetical protein FRX31_007100 [Thalictrum thalictroides]
MFIYSSFLSTCSWSALSSELPHLQVFLRLLQNLCLFHEQSFDFSSIFAYELGVSQQEFSFSPLLSYDTLLMDVSTKEACFHLVELPFPHHLVFGEAALDKNDDIDKFVLAAEVQPLEELDNVPVDAVPGSS